MLLTPHEILKHLGFDVPEAGVEINPCDAYLTTQALSLTGRTLNVNAIPNADLLNTRKSMAFLVAAARSEPEQPQTESSAETLRSTFAVLLKQSFRCTNNLYR
jgi:hypothetical protein